MLWVWSQSFGGKKAYLLTGNGSFDEAPHKTRITLKRASKNQNIEEEGEETFSRKQGL
jgi:hypothetical protein